MLLLLTIPHRIAAYALFGHRFGSLKLAIVFLGVAALVAFFARRRGSPASR